MKCPNIECGKENEIPRKWGKYCNGDKKYCCRFCGKQFRDEEARQRIEDKNKQRSKMDYNKNVFDEYITYEICKILKSFGVKKINGIGSSRSIAGLLECPHQTVSVWIKKYSSPEIHLKRKMTEKQIIEYVKLKKYGLSILEIFADNLPYGFLQVVNEIKEIQENLAKETKKILANVGAKEAMIYKEENENDTGKELVIHLK